jgi:hypothetical protein
MKAIIITDRHLTVATPPLIQAAFLENYERSSADFINRINSAMDESFEDIIFFNEPDDRLAFLSSIADALTGLVLVLALPASNAGELGRSFRGAERISIADLEALAAKIRPDLAQQRLFADEKSSLLDDISPLNQEEVADYANVIKKEEEEIALDDEEDSHVE